MWLPTGCWKSDASIDHCGTFEQSAIDAPSSATETEEERVCQREVIHK
jgi:predicted nuclease with RNAse H fold